MSQIKGEVSPAKISFRKIFLNIVNRSLLGIVLAYAVIIILLKYTNKMPAINELPFIATIVIIVFVLILLDLIYLVYYLKHKDNIKLENLLNKIIMDNDNYYVYYSKPEATANSTSGGTANARATISKKIEKAMVVQYFYNYEKEKLILRIDAKKGMNAKIITDSGIKNIQEYFTRKIGKCKIKDETEFVLLEFNNFKI